MRAIAAEWPRLLRMLDDLAELYDPDEIPIIDYLDLWQCVMRLSCYGVRFDDSFLARLDELHLDIIGTEEDGDSDLSDERTDKCDADDDAGTYPQLVSMYRHWTMPDERITSDEVLNRQIREACRKVFGRPPNPAEDPMRAIASAPPVRRETESLEMKLSDPDAVYAAGVKLITDEHLRDAGHIHFREKAPAGVPDWPDDSLDDMVVALALSEVGEQGDLLAVDDAGEHDDSEMLY